MPILEHQYTIQTKHRNTNLHRCRHACPVAMMCCWCFCHRKQAVPRAPVSEEPLTPDQRSVHETFLLVDRHSCWLLCYSSVCTLYSQLLSVYHPFVLCALCIMPLIFRCLHQWILGMPVVKYIPWLSFCCRICLAVVCVCVWGGGG